MKQNLCHLGQKTTNNKNRRVALHFRSYSMQSEPVPTGSQHYRKMQLPSFYTALQHCFRIAPELSSPRRSHPTISVTPGEISAQAFCIAGRITSSLTGAHLSVC